MKKNYLSIIETSKYLQKLLYNFLNISIIVYIILIFIVITSFIIKISVLTSFIMIILSCIPIISLLFSFAIYENTYTSDKINLLLVKKLILCLFFLFLPVLILTINMDYSIDKSITYLNQHLVGFGFLSLTIALTLLLRHPIFKLYFDVKYIMSGNWLINQNEFGINHFKIASYIDRSSLYNDKSAILAFQNTISCPKLDSLECYNRIKDNLPNDFKVLDIGGGNGEFTFELLKEIKNSSNKNANYICLVDPTPFKNEYKDLLNNGVLKESIINFSEFKFEEWEGTGENEFDLIIASHSLYGVIDNNDNIDINLLMKKLIGFLKNKNSQLIVILASKESRAYRFKQECLDLIFENKIIDFNAREFYENTIEFNFSKRVKTRVDNFIDLSVYIDDYDNHNFKRLKLWLSYFLRINLSTKDDYLFHTLVEILKKYIQSVYELSEFEIKKFNAIKSDVHNNSRVLTHKSEIFIFSLDKKYTI